MKEWHKDYSYVKHNDVSVNDGPHISSWTYNIIIKPYGEVNSVKNTTTKYG